MDPRGHFAPTAAHLKSTLVEIEKVLADIEKPAEPVVGDLVHGLVHVIFANHLRCGVGQEMVRRFENEFVDRNEFRVTEAYETEEMIVDLKLPEAFDRCLVAQESIAEVYNDQNSVSLEYLREASVSERKDFFARVPAIPQRLVEYMNHLVAWEEVMLSPRSTQRVQVRLGLDPKSKDVISFIDKARALFVPYGHIPTVIGPDLERGKVNDGHALWPACLLVRLGPQKKLRKK